MHADIYWDVLFGSTTGERLKATGMGKGGSQHCHKKGFGLIRRASASSTGAGMSLRRCTTERQGGLGLLFLRGVVMRCGSFLGRDTNSDEVALS